MINKNCGNCAKRNGNHCDDGERLELSSVDETELVFKRESCGDWALKI